MIIIPKDKAEQMRRERIEAASRQAQPPAALIDKEKVFAQALATLAARHGVDLMAMGDINIGGLIAAAQAAGATEADVAGASAILLAHAKDVEAESGMNWADTWLAMKARLPAHLAELAQQG
ncbi:MAG: hypothetical protein WCU80_08445 [Paludibacteraceae bacterium]